MTIDLLKEGGGDNFPMTMNAFDSALLARDPGQRTGEREERPDLEMPGLARRRQFTASYKHDVVAEHDVAPTGEEWPCWARGVCIPAASPSGGGPAIPPPCPRCPGSRPSGC